MLHLLCGYYGYYGYIYMLLILEVPFDTGVTCVSQEFTIGQRDPNRRLRPLPRYRPCCSPTTATPCESPVLLSYPAW